MDSKQDVVDLSEGALRQGAEALLLEAGLGSLTKLQALPGGANNRVFLVEHNGGRALLKAYFRHPEDKRDRLGAEYSFCAFAWKHGLRMIPQPLARDEARLLALYEYVDGKPVRDSIFKSNYVLQAAGFFRQLNRHKEAPGSHAIAPASDACFSLSDHFNLVEQRLALLTKTELEPAAADFINRELLPAWQRTAPALKEGLQKLRLKMDENISDEQKCLSPSDFGFHNALIESGGRLRFLDFEYAGWDDPAKMAADFFSQVAVPVPFEHFKTFVNEAVSEFPKPENIIERTRWVLPVHGFKWICLMLNEFLPAGRARRRFAAGSDSVEKKAAQLEKARRALKRLTDNPLWPI